MLQYLNIKFFIFLDLLCIINMIEKTIADFMFDY